MKSSYISRLVAFYLNKTENKSQKPLLIHLIAILKLGTHFSGKLSFNNSIPTPTTQARNKAQKIHVK